MNVRNRFRLLCFLLPAFVLTLTPSSLSAADKPDYLMYIGTFTQGTSEGIYVFQYNSGTGETAPMGLAAKVQQPTFLALHPNGRYLYTVNEMGRWEGQKGGGISAFSMDKKTGQLTLLNSVSSKGSGPTHLSLDKSGRWLYAANYGSGSVTVIPVGLDGHLGEAVDSRQHTGSSANPSRQKGPHAHWIEPLPGGRFVMTADLGLDQLITYPFDPQTGKLGEGLKTQVAGGSGPRHFAFHPKKNWGYLINEMSNTIIAYQGDYSKGTWQELQTVKTLPPDFTGTSYTAEVAVHPNGKFLYGSNRGHDSIALFDIDPNQGTLTLKECFSTQGKYPRHFALDPKGKHLVTANQDGENMLVYRIDSKTGRLTALGDPIKTPKPVCVLFVPLR